MCNLYQLRKGVDEIRQLFADQGLQLSFPEGVPNLEPKEIRITDPAPIVRIGQGGLEMIIRRWSWPGPNGKPVFNLRSEGRNFSNRCLAIADGFYEFTTSDNPKAKRKDKWLFSPANGGLLGIAAVIRTVTGIGEAFSMLTADSSAEVAPIHNRQLLLPRPDHWLSWLDPSTPPPTSNNWTVVSANRVT